MKYIDDDMDELFNKAGRQYPLKTEPKDWNAVRSALHPEETAAAAKKAGLRRYLPLLLLLLIPAVYFVIQKDAKVTTHASAETNSANNLMNGKTSDVHTSEDKSNSPGPGNANNRKQADSFISDKQIASISSENTNRSNPHIKTNSSILNSSKNHTSQTVQGSDPRNTNPFAHLRTHPLTTTPQPSTEIVMDKPLRQLGGETSVPYIDKKKPSGKTGFYYGISAAPDVSAIKGQSIKGTGYSAGIIAGYQLTLRWSVEAGVLWSNKNYFTDGKYFNKKGAGIPDYINVYWLDGGCNMLEFPVLVRYDFSPKKNTFFGTIGLTSYMMKKEDYKYMADAGVGGGEYEGHRNYDHSGDHLFSNLQLSAGYKFSLSPKMNMRIEPYFKAPLKKIGIGKMPITSAGLTLSLMRDFR